MTRIRITGGAVLLALAGGVSGCGGTMMSPPPPVVQTQAAPDGPSVDIMASGQSVREILAARAKARGAAPRMTAEAVIIERALAETNETLAASCGPHQPGRIVRVVLGTQPVAQGTRVTEQRFIVDGARVCRLPLNEADWKQAETSLHEVKSQAEKKTAAR